MARRRVGIAALVLVSAIGVAGAVVWAFFQTPDFYREELARPVPLVVRQNEAKVFIERTLQLVENVRESDAWSQTFDQNGVNSWIVEELETHYGERLPAGMSEPRVQFSDGWADVGFRYESEKFSGVVSIRVRARIPEPNLLAFEVDSVRAGILPLPLEQVIDQVTERGQLHRLRIERTRKGDTNVFLVDLGDRIPAGAILEGVSIEKGKLTVAGRRLAETGPDANPPAEAELPDDA